MKTAHPRMGREQDVQGLLSGTYGGSSPHGRGTASLHIARKDMARFIPAWAGNSLPLPLALPLALHPVHPRMGGEQGLGYDRRDYIHGSSPHGRGTGVDDVCCRYVARFIPAWAGNSMAYHPLHSGRPVHPRMGGEQGIVQDMKTGKRGSSPHGRGTATAGNWQSDGWRFIPAWAGNRARIFPLAEGSAVHPRMGGEQCFIVTPVVPDFGSSPHGRGTGYFVGFFWSFQRFIPAWAGNRSHLGCIDRCPAVHPRMGGEQETGGKWPDQTSGSSPHGRGTGKIAAMAIFLFRFIPAWAGNRRT